MKSFASMPWSLHRAKEIQSKNNAVLFTPKYAIYKLKKYTKYTK